MCVAWQGDSVIVAGVQCDERINGSCRLMEGGGPTCSPLSGASCNRAGRNLSGWAAELFFMFWMSPCSFLPARARMIWMSPARVMFLKHEVYPPELIIVIQLTASVLRSLCRDSAGCADVRHDCSGWADKQLLFTKPYIYWSLRGRRYFFFGMYWLARSECQALMLILAAISLIISVIVFTLCCWNPLNTFYLYFFWRRACRDWTRLPSYFQHFNLHLLYFYEQFSAILGEVVK